jgi:aldehyde:ferredoxin oxidoreductase
MTDFGYAGKILRVDLSSGTTTEVPTSDYADRFLGGRGVMSKIYWDEVSPEVSAFDPENRLMFATGPLAGLPEIGSGRCEVTGKSPAPAPEHFCYCNLGGRWGAQLKFAGYDAIVVHGRSEKPVYLFIHDDGTQLRDASPLWGKGSNETRELLKGELGNSVRVAAIGPAGENMVTMANILADNDASGSGGLGAVMGSKRLKAVAVQSGKKGVKVAQPERLRELISYYRRLRPTFHYVPILDELIKPYGEVGTARKKDPCHGCLGNCMRAVYQSKDGKIGKWQCGSAFYYIRQAARYYGGWSEIPFDANRLADWYGVDIYVVELMMYWLNRCYTAGVITDESIGIPFSKLGSWEFIETLLRKLSLREGFGDVLAQGIVKAADSLGPGARAQLKQYIAQCDEFQAYGPSYLIYPAIMYAMEPRRPLPQIHEIAVPIDYWLEWLDGVEGAYLSTDVLRAIAKRFWGGELAVDFSTLEGKALAVKMVQDREKVKECLILCGWMWPITHIESSSDHVGDATLESKMLSAVTGREVDEEGLYRIGERVFNLYRAILVREGHRGRDHDVLPDTWYSKPNKLDLLNPMFWLPGKDGELISRKGATIEKEDLERMKDEYYQLRQWDVATGLQTRAQLEELGLKDIADELEQRGLTA